MFFLLSNIFVVIILLSLLYLLSAVWPPDSPWAPWWQMPQEVCFAIARLSKLTKKDIIYDLGCGTAKAIIIANKQYGAKGIGVEIDPLRYWIARFNVWRNRQMSPNVKIIKDNFFNVDLKNATVIYMYLVPNALRRLTPKLLKELKPGTKIVSYIYDVPETYKGKVTLQTHDKKNHIFIYTLRKTKQ